MSAARFLVTGGTGLIGSHLGAELLRRGAEVEFLVRKDAGPASGLGARPSSRLSTDLSPRLSAETRLANLLDWHAVDAAQRERAHAVAGDVLIPGLVLADSDSERLSDRLDGIIHCASSTSFAERTRASTRRVNVEGLRNTLEFAAAAGCSAFHLISTVYAAGRTSGICEDVPPAGDHFYNVYEESKCAAELLALGFCHRHDMRLIIYRPAIVYGDSRTGRTFRFNALYFAIRTVLLLKEAYERDIALRAGSKAAAMGVSRVADGTVHLPIKVVANRASGLNLIPIDYLVDAFMAIMAEAPSDGIFHIVNSQTTPIADLITFASSIFHITGLQAVARDGVRPPRTPLETLFDHCLEAYLPYVCDGRTFVTGKTGPILARRGIRCPDFDLAMFRRCADYGRAVDWHDGMR